MIDSLMRARFVLVCLLACLSGCGKQPAASPASGEAVAVSAAAPASSPAQLASPNAAAQDQPQIEALLKELTQAVRRYSVEQRRVPRNLEELAASGYLPGVPAAPAGKRFVIDKNLQVTLGNR